MCIRYLHNVDDYSTVLYLLPLPPSGKENDNFASNLILWINYFDICIFFFQFHIGFFQQSFCKLIKCNVLNSEARTISYNKTKCQNHSVEGFSY